MSVKEPQDGGVLHGHIITEPLMVFFFLQKTNKYSFSFGCLPNFCLDMHIILNEYID